MLSEHYKLSQKELIHLMIFTGLMSTDAPRNHKQVFKKKIEKIIGHDGLNQVMYESKKIIEEIQIEILSGGK